MYPTIAAAIVMSIASLSVASAQTKAAAPATAAAPAKTAAPPKAAAGISSPMKPGLWEITVLNETAGSPTKRTVTARECYSADDVKSLQRVLPKQREFTMSCESRDVKLEGAAATWRVECRGKTETLNGTAKVTLASDSYTGSAALQRVSEGKTSKVQQTIGGKWISACK